MMKERFELFGPAEDYVAAQHECGPAVIDVYLRQLVEQEPCRTVLDVGCGVGKAVTALVRAGYDAYGLDLPDLGRFWAAEKNDSQRFIAGSATHLPFADNAFDFVYSFGVIEHIGTVYGDCALKDDYWKERQEYAREIVRVTKPGGRILIACPNKAFPIDIQHGPSDMVEKAGRIRSFIYDKTGMNVHKTWGRYHLLSYPEVEDLFVRKGGGKALEALPLRNYFQFGRFKKGFLKPFGGLAEFWVNHMPETIRSSFLNPYLMAQIRK